MADREACLAWFGQRQGKVSYSMGAWGPGSYDCSSAVYSALVAGGWFPPGKRGYTDTLYGDLEAAGWKQTSSPVRGDVFIWGKRGASSGSAGHTGMFVDRVGIIHCNFDANGISTTNYAQSHQWAGQPPAVIYHHPGNTGGNPAPNPKPKPLTPQEQTAIDIWKESKAAHYSMESTAGKLGNIELECGMKADTSELGGGPGYGIVQWTSPNAAEPGVVYVQRLLRQAGIRGDYRQAATQAKLLVWHMTHGQWIGVVDPKTVEGFKQLKDPRQAALAFLKNFERAGVEKLQARQSAAERWLQFLKSYEANGGGSGEQPTPPPEKATLENAGELELFGIKEGKAFAKGWHFSSGKPNQTLVVMNAETGKEMKRLTPALLPRPDIKKEHPEVEGVERCGFEITFTVPALTTIYLKGIRSNGDAHELVFDKLLTFEPVTNAPIDPFAEGNERFFFEIIRKETVIARGNTLLNTLSWSNELQFAPTTTIELPIAYEQFFLEREEVKLYINHKVFHGITKHYTRDTAQGKLMVELIHVVDEWRYRQLSTNLAAKNRTINDLYSTYDFRYSKQWHLAFLQKSAQTVIDYVYSRQTKLEALTQTCELTPDIYWRVGFQFGRKLEFGSFGEKKNYSFSTQPTSEQNIRIIGEPEITHEFADVVNMATVYGEKSDSGMTSMSLREVYFEPLSQVKGFPVRTLRKGINNERGYDYMQFSKLAPNNDIEYTVVDEESIKMESNKAIETTFSFNDLAPFSKKDEEITDEDRAKAARTAYEAAIKNLKESRRYWSMTVEVEELPREIEVGDKVRLFYDLSLFQIGECSSYLEEILTKDDWFYVTKIDYEFDATGGETNKVTLAKEIRRKKG